MENASKALLMAGGVLIGVLVLSLVVYLFASFGSKSASVHEQIKEEQIAQFNSQFTVYLDQQDITIYDIVSVAKAAYEYNQTTENAKIKVCLDSSNKISGKNYNDLSTDSWQDSYEKLFEKDRDQMNNIKNQREPLSSDEKVKQRINKIGYLPRYSCKGNNVITYDNDTGRVNYIKFKYEGV